jgi:hypothetical protein
MLYQNKVGSIVNDGAEMTTQTRILPNGGAEIKLTAAFQTVNRSASLPAIHNPLIPGGFDSSGR